MSTQLYNLPAPKGANRNRKRIGRGESSGHGKTAGRGGKGQTARTGKGKPSRGFEGGQMPMYRRMPKRGFKHAPNVQMAAINLDILCERFEPGSTVDLAAAKKLGLARNTDQALRILGRGDCSHPLTIRARHVTQGARQRIEAAGGRIESDADVHAAPES